MSGASEPRAPSMAPVPTLRVARKAVVQPAARLPFRQNPAQQRLGQPTGSVTEPQAGSATNSSASAAWRNSSGYAPMPVSSSMIETQNVHATNFSRRSMDGLAQRPLANTFHVPDPHAADPTQRSIASSTTSISTSRNSVRGPTIVSPATNVTLLSNSSSSSHLPRTHSVDSTMEEEITSPYCSLCGNYKGAIPTSHATIRCLICSSASKPSVISSLCFSCYAAGVSWAGHNHDVSFYACDSDSISLDTRLPQHTWIVRRNASTRLWYEHRQTRYKTYMRPLTAVCGLPSEWQQIKDPEGKIYYENILTGQLSRTPPGGLPSGWREAKDPDGKLFFIHDELQLASWYRPGEEPLVCTPDSDGKTTASNSASNTSNVVVKDSQPDAVTKLAQVVVKPNPLAVKPNGAAPIAAVKPLSLQEVTLQTVTEATINLIDPSEGGIVRNTKIAAHMAGQGITSTVKAVKRNERLQNFARGTGIAEVNRQVKKAWKKAAKEVDARTTQGVTVWKRGSRGQDIILEEVDDEYIGEYVVEYNDGTMEYYGADGQLQYTVEHQNTSGARLSRLASSGERITGQEHYQHRPQQYQTRQQQYQNTQQQAYLWPSTDSTWKAEPEENTFVDHTESQGLYAGQEQNIYINQNPDIFIVQSQDIAVERGLTIYQDVSVEQNIPVFEDQTLIDLDLGIQQKYGIEQELELEYDQSMTQEVEIEGEGVHVTVDFYAVGDLGACVDS